MALGQLILKLFFWDNAQPGVPTLIIAIFFLSGAQLFLLGFIGEIVGQLFRQSKNLPMVIEIERINFGE